MKKYLVLAVVLIAAYIGWAQFGPKSGDSPLTDASALVQVVVPTLEGNAIIGKRIFDAKCAACHGANAAGQDGLAPPLVHKFYEPSHHGDASFLLAVRNGVRAHHWPFGPMLPVQGLTNADVAMVVEYVRALQRENGIY